MDFEGLKEYVLAKLENELSNDLHYHSIDHTLDVMESVSRIAEMENVNGHDQLLLKTGALFHDLGFLETYDEHENASIRMAEKILPQYGYTSDEIKVIAGLIRSTEIPQKPQTHLEKIMADADLDYLGRDDLFLIGQRLQYEWYLHGKVSSLREWHEKQLAFLKTHEFFTDSAKKLRQERKQENILELETLMCEKKS
jgi:HD superfamily phosphodiesterase